MIFYIAKSLQIAINKKIFSFIQILILLNNNKVFNKTVEQIKTIFQSLLNLI